MKLLKLIVLLFALLTFTACPKLDYKKQFRFSNNSTHDVYIHLNGSIYPDTAVSRFKIGVPFTKGESRYYSYNYENDSDALCLFIFDADIFDTCSWEVIQNDYKILQRYDISYENIKTLKYLITYPPDERMKDVKMYPAYGE
jgi:hypothetical protein